MSEFQVTFWRDLPSMVVARDETGEVTKASLPARFQEAIDEAAMRLDESDAIAYLEGWHRGDWTVADGDRTAVVAQVSGELDARWTPAAVTAYLDGLGTT